MFHELRPSLSLVITAHTGSVWHWPPCPLSSRSWQKCPRLTWPCLELGFQHLFSLLLYSLYRFVACQKYYLFFVCLSPWTVTPTKAKIFVTCFQCCSLGIKNNACLINNWVWLFSLDFSFYVLVFFLMSFVTTWRKMSYFITDVSYIIAPAWCFHFKLDTQ